MNDSTIVSDNDEYCKEKYIPDNQQNCGGDMKHPMNPRSTSNIGRLFWPSRGSVSCRPCLITIDNETKVIPSEKDAHVCY